MNTYQEPKYEIKEGKIYNRQSGEMIPDDEPIFILRARDRKAPSIIAHYAELCQDPTHKDAVRTRSAQFFNWQECHKDRVKEPDTQRDFGWTSAGTKPA